MPKITITIDVTTKSEAYKAINHLGTMTKVDTVETDDEVWVIEKPEDLKYLFKKNFIRHENGEHVIIE